MITIFFNDELCPLEKACSLAELLLQKNRIDTNFAVAINRIFISRSQYELVFFKEGDVVELVSPMQGG